MTEREGERGSKENVRAEKEEGSEKCHVALSVSWDGRVSDPFKSLCNV